jgi:AAA+ superfamily predicted ATPase
MPADVPDFAALWTREAILSSAALIVELDAVEHLGRVTTLAKRSAFPLIVTTEDRLTLADSRIFEVVAPQAEEMVEVWRDALGSRAETLNGSLETIAKQFRLGPDQVQAIANGIDSETDLEAAVWSAARQGSRQRLDGLAQRIESQAMWDDLVLPEAQAIMLRQIVAHVRQRSKVYDAWGFGARSQRGLGISALFTGASGTGKTLAAEVIASQLRLDLYRIDLSQIVSKYIGETEKNLHRVFEAAEGSGSVLLFDEADALFGKRSEVRDSHDRYANIEVGYLLQRMEAYSGLVILTTNLKNAIDPAFLRRIRFVVQFPFPEYEDRRRIWQTIFPTAMPRVDLDVDRLATLSLAGGNIRNIAINAAFLAADEDSDVGMDHLLRSARSEFAKIERPMTDFEVGGAS